MNATDIIQSMYLSGELHKLCKQVAPPQYSDDLLHEIVAELLEKPPYKIEQMHKDGYIKFYVVRMTLNMFRSKHSSFHKKYRHFDECTEIETNYNEPMQDYCMESDEIQQSRIDRCHQAYNDLGNVKEYPYEKKLLDLYLQVGNVSLISRETGIPYRTVRHQLKAIIAKIKQQTDGISID